MSFGNQVELNNIFLFYVHADFDRSFFNQLLDHEIISINQKVDPNTQTIGVIKP